MDLIYQLGIRFYLLAVQVASLFNEKARLMAKGRKATFSYLEKNIDHSRPLVWVHCASLGEFEQGRPLIEQIKKQHPVYRVLLTFFSPSGYEIRKDYGFADYICYLPADTAHNAKNFIELTKPEKVFFIKYEYWYNYIRLLAEKKIPLYLVSAIFRDEQLFFKSGFQGRWYRKILQKVSHFFVQNEQSADLLFRIGTTNFTVTGDTRFDRVAGIAANSKELPLISRFKNGQKLIVAGSSWPPDEALLVDFMRHDKHSKIIFAPHEVKETNIKRLMGQLPAGTIRYSQAGNISVEKARVLVIDTIGLLSSVYRYADIAYVGGGFGVGIHNTLEAAIFNIPVLFGPKYLKFQEAVELVKVGAAFPINNSEELTNILMKLLSDDLLVHEIAEMCRSFMLQNLGATQKVMEKVF
jgi:3-deoxy-D-manno-octulosonic-acid transferase